MFFWNSLVFLRIQRMLAIWSLVPLPFLKSSWTSGSSQFTYFWSLAWRILSITLLVCEMSASVRSFEHSLALPFFGIGMKTDLITISQREKKLLERRSTLPKLIKSGQSRIGTQALWLKSTCPLYCTASVMNGFAPTASLLWPCLYPFSTFFYCPAMKGNQHVTHTRMISNFFFFF